MIRFFNKMDKLLMPINISANTSNEERFPFISFQLIGQFTDLYNTDYKLWKCLVDFESEKLRNKTFWSMNKLTHYNFRHSPMKRGTIGSIGQ